jgi:hypothetical protein
MHRRVAARSRSVPKMSLVLVTGQETRDNGQGGKEEEGGGRGNACVLGEGAAARAKPPDHSRRRTHCLVA